MEQYILLYGNKKPEDVICIKNMFEMYNYLSWDGLTRNIITIWK